MDQPKPKSPTVQGEQDDVELGELDPSSKQQGSRKGHAYAKLADGEKEDIEDVVDFIDLIKTNIGEVRILMKDVELAKKR